MGSVAPCNQIMAHGVSVKGCLIDHKPSVRSNGCSLQQNSLPWGVKACQVLVENKIGVVNENEPMECMGGACHYNKFDRLNH